MTAYGIIRSHARQILPGSCIDLDDIPLIDEERDRDLGAGLNNGGLSGAGGGVALETGFGVGDGKLHEKRRLNGKNITLVRADLDHLVLLDELQLVADLILIKRDLLIGIQIHEIEKVSVRVQVLHVLAVNTGFLKLLGGTERFLDDAAADDILQLGADESSALARFNVLELNDLPDSVLIL